MSTAETVTLNGALQALVDARLDTIDRMLLGRVPRADRLAIVREVESQIHEQLVGQDPAELDRDDVLAILGRLDPPEAYLPEEDEDDALRHSAPTAVPGRPSGRRNREGWLGGVLGLVSLALILFGSPFAYLFALLTESEVVLMGGGVCLFLMATGCALTSLVLSVRGRRQGVWPVVGIVSSALAMITALGAMGIVLVMALG
ncbi:MAG: hypothetical protein U0835_04000 [Isosphaeraceae bacterium]